MKPMLTVVGGGLAGSEAAWQIARRGLRVRLYEMRPRVPTPAHTTDRLGELVCSNSLKSDRPGTAAHLLKEELRGLGSLLVGIADEVKVPAGHALAVDRDLFCRRVTEEILKNPRIEVIREECVQMPSGEVSVVATGPLTSEAFSKAICDFVGFPNLYFYDAISPIVDASTLDGSKLFPASRYGKGGEDYLNAALSQAEYQRFYEALVTAEAVPLRNFEKPIYFESCLPIEELARRGEDTLRFGPMRPVGLTDPRTGKRPYAAVQLRLENLMADSYNLVGFQNHLRFPEQLRVFRVIPGLEHAEILRYGQMHRNSYVHSPRVLLRTLAARRSPNVFFAGQICGVEGYVESIATGLLAGANAARLAAGREAVLPPRQSACGSLLSYLESAGSDFQPANISFGLLPAPPADCRRKDRHGVQIEEGRRCMPEWIPSFREA